MGRKKEEGGTPPGPNVLSAGARSEKEKKRETWGGGRHRRGLGNADADAWRWAFGKKRRLGGCFAPPQLGLERENGVVISLPSILER